MKKTRRLTIGIIALALFGVGAVWYAASDSAAPGAFTDLDAESFTQLRNEFNADADNVRIIVLLSPT